MKCGIVRETRKGDGYEHRTIDKAFRDQKPTRLKGQEALPGQPATTIGLNVEGKGARFYMTRNWALFGEMPYHRARLGYTSNDDNDGADPFGFRATYRALTFSLGVSDSG